MAGVGFDEFVPKAGVFCDVPEVFHEFAAVGDAEFHAVEVNKKEVVAVAWSEPT